jgi:DNA-binding CsgD family transcriptional regulator
VPDCVEALAALEELERAEELTEHFDRQATALDRRWAQATAARCRGLVLAAGGDLTDALSALESACLGHRASTMPFELGRTLLALGIARRRARQRRAARESLDEALAIFEQLGASLWTDKARAEIGRLGGRTPAGQSLTPTEQRIAQLVAHGLSNREVASEIYRKLGVRSRSELTRRFAARSEDGSTRAHESG